MPTDDEYEQARMSLTMPNAPQYGTLSPEAQAARRNLGAPAPTIQRMYDPVAIGTGPQAMTPEQGAAMMQGVGVQHAGAPLAPAWQPWIHEKPGPNQMQSMPMRGPGYSLPQPMGMGAQPISDAQAASLQRQAQDMPFNRPATQPVSDVEAKRLEAKAQDMPFNRPAKNDKPMNAKEKALYAEGVGMGAKLNAQLGTYQPVVANGPAATSYYQPPAQGTKSPLQQYAEQQKANIRQQTEAPSPLEQKLQEERAATPAAAGTNGQVRRDATPEERQGKRGFLGLGPTNFGGGWL